MKCSVISGELVVQGKLRPVSLQGKKKEEGREDGGKAEVVGGGRGGRLKKALFQF